MSIDHVLENDTEIAGAAVSPDGAHALTWSRSDVRFWDRATGQAAAQDQASTIRTCAEDRRGAWSTRDGALVALRCDGVAIVDIARSEGRGEAR